MVNMNKQDRWKGQIVTNPDILMGKPIVAGIHISVELILDRLSSGWSMVELLENYPSIKLEDILAALVFSADVIPTKPFVTVDEIKKGKQS